MWHENLTCCVKSMHGSTQLKSELIYHCFPPHILLTFSTVLLLFVLLAILLSSLLNVFMKYFGVIFCLYCFFTSESLICLSVENSSFSRSGLFALASLGCAIQ